jgi:hypothetical protein
MVSLNYSVYPNPANDILNVTVQSEEVFHLKIYSVNGEIVYSESNLSGIHKIDISELASGNYLIEISNTEFRKTEKLNFPSSPTTSKLLGLLFSSQYFSEVTEAWTVAFMSTR